MNHRSLLVLIPALAVIAIVVFFAGSGFWSGTRPQTPTLSPPVTTPTFAYPEHHISPDYFRNVSPPQPRPPVPETERITIILSRTTFDQLTVGKHKTILRIPVEYLDFQKNFVNTTGYPTWHYENGLSQHDRISMVRMPADTFASLINETQERYIDFDVPSYVVQADSIYALRRESGLEAANESVIAGNAKPVPSLAPFSIINQTASQNMQTTPTVAPLKPNPRV